MNETVGLRMPKDMKKFLQSIAENNRRSLSAQIIYMLEKQIKQEGTNES